MEVPLVTLVWQVELVVPPVQSMPEGELVMTPPVLALTVRVTLVLLWRTRSGLAMSVESAVPAAPPPQAARVAMAANSAASTASFTFEVMGGDPATSFGQASA